MRISDWSSDVCSSDLGNLLPELSIADIERLRAAGTISGGMIPTLETCVKAVSEGVEAAVILDGRVPPSMLLDIFTGGGIAPLVTRLASRRPRLLLAADIGTAQCRPRGRLSV